VLLLLLLHRCLFFTRAPVSDVMLRDLANNNNNNLYSLNKWRGGWAISIYY